MATRNSEGKVILSDQDKHNIELSKAMGLQPRCKIDEDGYVSEIVHPRSPRGGIPFGDKQ